MILKVNQKPENHKIYKKFLNLREMTSCAAAEFKDKPYLKYFDSNNEIKEISFNKFDELTSYLGTFFMNLGGNYNIAVYSENRYEWILAYVATVGSGNTVIPLDKEIVFDQVSEFIDFSGTDIVVFSRTYIDNIVEYARSDKKIKYFICLDDIQDFKISDSRFIDFRTCIKKGEELVREGNRAYSKLRTDSSKPCAIIFTSGTTGTSKGVMLTEDNLTYCIWASANMVDIARDDVLFSVLPFNHTYETSCGLLTPLTLGCTVCINNSLKYVLKNTNIFKPTAMVLVPLFVSTIYKKIIDEIKKTKKEKIIKGGVTLTKAARKAKIDARRLIFAKIHKSLGGRLKNIICGGAALDPVYVERFEEFGITIAQGYGITECSPLVSVVPYDRIKYNSVGVPVEGSVVKIMDIDDVGDEYDLPPYKTGEICVKGPHVMAGYYNNPDATKDAYNREGFFKTGDFGYIDDDGYLYITGRKKNIIIFDNGKNIYPEEIEEYLYRCDLISEVVVVEREINKSKLLTAIIYPDYSKFVGFDDVKIREAVKSSVQEINKDLPSYKQVRNIEIKKTEFEKTSSKKIIRYKIDDKS